MAAFFPIPNLLPQSLVDELVAELRGPNARWQDGKKTAGIDASKKLNQELEPTGKMRQALSERLTEFLEKQQTPETNAYRCYARPSRNSQFLFSKTGAGGGYADHVDNVFMTGDGISLPRLRADLSITIFLSPPESYQGGELMLNSDMPFAPKFKMPAGGAILYTTDVVHRVTPVNSGERLVAITWIESLLANPTVREISADIMECLNYLSLAKPGTLPVEHSKQVIQKLEKIRTRVEKFG